MRPGDEIGRTVQIKLNELDSRIQKFEHRTGVDMQSRAIFNLRRGVRDTDAVNVAQLKDEMKKLREDLEVLIEEARRR